MILRSGLRDFITKYDFDQMALEGKCILLIHK